MVDVCCVKYLLTAATVTAETQYDDNDNDGYDWWKNQVPKINLQ